MSTRASLFTPVLLVGCFIVMISFAVRASFGVFQIPIAAEFGWARAEFSMAIAIQNLAWGIGQPLFGAFAERIGDRLAIALGAVLYALGLVMSGLSTDPFSMQAWEVLVGFGIAGTGLGVILAVVGRASSAENRSMSLAIAAAAGSAGQVFGAPVAEALMTVMSWQSVFFIFAGALLAMLITLPLMRAPVAPKVEVEESLRETLTRAFRDPSFSLISIGFFSCGYQLGFITAHFPAFVTEACGPIAVDGILHSVGVTTTSALGAVAISLIGLFNIFGTLAAGWLGARYQKKNLLALVYTGRTIAAAVFILMPITPLSVLVFSAVMGSLWLATVPLTSGLVAHLYGLRYMGTLYGMVFLSHQIGSFIGVWLGGRLYDVSGDYSLVWWIGVAVGALSILVHLPIREIRPAVPAAA